MTPAQSSGSTIMNAYFLLDAFILVGMLVWFELADSKSRYRNRLKFISCLAIASVIFGCGVAFASH